MNESAIEIKMFLTKNCLTQAWLSNQLCKLGFSYDKSTISGALNGSIKGKRANIIVENSLKVAQRYESQMNTE